MKTIVTASELLREEEYEIIFLPESLCEEIDETIKQNKSHKDIDDFVSSAIEKFISSAIKQKTRRYPKKRFQSREHND